MLTLQLIFWMRSLYGNNVFRIIRYMRESRLLISTPLSLLRAVAAPCAAPELPWVPVKSHTACPELMHSPDTVRVNQPHTKCTPYAGGSGTLPQYTVPRK